MLVRTNDLLLIQTKLTTIDVSNPMSYEDIVELLVPVLMERGLMWKDYTVPGGTFRENLLRQPGATMMPEGHPAHQFTYENLKKQQGIVDENGDINIKRNEPVKEEVPTDSAAPVAEDVKPAEDLTKKMNGTSINGEPQVQVAA